MGLLKRLDIYSTYECELNVLDEVVYLKGVHHHDIASAPPSLIRGSLTLRIKKQVDIKRIKIRFNGINKANLFAKGHEEDSPKHTTRVLVDDRYDWKYDSTLFAPGTYSFPFQFAVSPKLPASIQHACGEVNYSLIAEIETRDPQLAKSMSKPVNLVRCVSDLAEVSCQTVVAMGCWRNLLCYQLIVSNKTLVIGEDVTVAIKIFPLHEERYVVHGIKVLLDQKLDYNTEAPDKYRKGFVKNHKIHLRTFNYNRRQGYIEEKMVLPIEKFYSRSYPGVPDLQIHPHTDNRDMCNFKITHGLKLGIILEEIEEPRKLGTRPSFSHSIDTVSSIVSETLFPPSRSSSRSSTSSDVKTIADERPEWIARNVKLVKEDVRRINEKVDLSLHTPIILLDPRCWDGQLPPPAYSALPLRMCEPFRVEKLYSGKCKSGVLPPSYNSTSVF